LPAVVVVHQFLPEVNLALVLVVLEVIAHRFLANHLVVDLLQSGHYGQFLALTIR
jgi:hypothetical protein